MLTARKEATDGGTVQMRATYVYDALGQRVQKQVWDGTSTTTTRFVHDLSGQEFAETDGSNNLLVRRLYLDGANAVLCWRGWTRTAASGTCDGPPGQRARDPGLCGRYQTRYADLRRLRQGAQREQPEQRRRHQVHGGRLDAETGHYHFTWRYYDPFAGRWVSRDPIGFDGGDFNTYRYVGNNATNGTDPSGLREDPLYNGWTKPFAWLGEWWNSDPKLDAIAQANAERLATREFEAAQDALAREAAAAQPIVPGFDDEVFGPGMHAGGLPIYGHDQQTGKKALEDVAGAIKDLAIHVATELGLQIALPGVGKVVGVLLNRGWRVVKVAGQYIAKKGTKEIPIRQLASKFPTQRMPGSALDPVRRGNYLNGWRPNRRQWQQIEAELRRLNVTIDRNAGNRLDAINSNIGAAFNHETEENLVRDGATNYQVFHELTHARQWTRLGKAAYQKTHPFDRELHVYR